MRSAGTATGKGARRGIAMATALGGLVIIGVMIAGVFFTSNQELRVGTNTFVQERAFRAAEFGINATLANWDNAEMLLLLPGGTREIVYDSAAAGWRDTVTITRLNATGFLIASTGTAFGGIQGTARRRTALLVRISIPSIRTTAALTSRDSVVFTQTPAIIGHDTGPTGWTCPPPEGSVAAIVLPDSSSFSSKNCPPEVCLQGSPNIFESAQAEDTSTYSAFDDETFKSLTMYSSKVYSSSSPPPNLIEPVVSAGACNKTSAKNWGDPARGIPAGPCESYFPIIHATGSGYKLQLSRGTGQGILLVDGDLEISGTFQFMGPVIVRGRFESRNSARIHGAVLVANQTAGDNVMANSSSITYSSCAIRKAFENAIPPKRVVERAWMEVF